MNDFKNISDRYRQQMLDLYNRYPKNVSSKSSQTSANSNANANTNVNFNNTPTNNTMENTPPPSEPLMNSNPDTQLIIQPKPINEENVPTKQTTENEDNIPIEEKYPTPIIPPFVYQSNHQDNTTQTTKESPISSDLTQFGYLKVSATSADGAIPLENVSIIVSKPVNDQDEILFTLLTNASGETTIIELPAPPENLSQSPNNSNIKPYAEYKISAYLHGYYQIINTKVPIFSNITSIQKINMIPLPSFTDERKVMTITIPESEPNL